MVKGMAGHNQAPDSRLAAAGLGRGDDVAPFERRWNCLGLDRRRPDESEFLDALEQGGMQLQLGEWHR